MRSLWKVASLAALVAVTLAGPVAACDSTGCLLITRGTGGVLRRGGFNLELSYRSLDQSSRLSGGAEAVSVSRPRVDFERRQLLPAYHQDLEGRDSSLQLEAAYGLASGTTLYASAPLVTLRSHRIGHAAIVTPYDAWGFGDLVVGARQAIALPFAGQATASVGLKLPSGSNGLLDPFDRKILDPVLQPGTGSLDVLLSGQYGRRLASPRLDLALSALYQANTTSGRGYRFGNEAIVTLSVSRPLGRRLTVSSQVKWLREGRDSYLGQPVSSSGARFTYVGAGVRLALSRFSYYALTQVPITRFVNETQLGPKLALIAGVSRSF